MTRTLLRHLAVANAVLLAGAVIAWRVGVLPTPAGVPAMRENVQEFMSSSKSYSFTGLSACARHVDDDPDTINPCSVTELGWSVSTPGPIPPTVYPLPERTPTMRHHDDFFLKQPGIAFFTSKAYFMESPGGEPSGPHAREQLTTHDWSAATPQPFTATIVTLPDPGLPTEFPIRRIPLWYIFEPECP